MSWNVRRYWRWSWFLSLKWTLVSTCALLPEYDTVLRRRPLTLKDWNIAKWEMGVFVLKFGQHTDCGVLEVLVADWGSRHNSQGYWATQDWAAEVPRAFWRAGLAADRQSPHSPDQPACLKLNCSVQLALPNQWRSKPPTLLDLLLDDLQLGQLFLFFLLQLLMDVHSGAHTATWKISFPHYISQNLNLDFYKWMHFSNKKYQNSNLLHENNIHNVMRPEC